MSHIPHFFNFATYYNEVASAAPEGATLVEVGTYCGRSLLHLAEAVKAKGCRVVGVDWCRGSKEFVEHGHEHAPFFTTPGKLAGELVKNIGTQDIPLIVSRSDRGAEFFADGACWFVFLDADHSYESVSADTAAWWPKVASGGRLAGHDYETPRYPGVRKAVDEFAAAAGLKVRVVDGCWEVVKP